MKKFKEILDNAKNGVLLVSWGGNVNSSSIPAHIQQEMIKGFARLPLQVIWKWENASTQEFVSTNVHVTAWLPQQDILCKLPMKKNKSVNFHLTVVLIMYDLNVGHPNVKAFWTHGGNLGTIETVHCGKPAIITPFYGDQYLNAAALNRRGMGFRHNLLDITADSIYNVVQKVLDPK